MNPDFKDLAQIYQQRALESLSEEDLAHAKRYRIAAELEAVLRECLEALLHCEGVFDEVRGYPITYDLTIEAIAKIDEVLSK